MLINDVLVKDRPRERLLKHGISVLSDAELLSIILRSGSKGISVLDLANKLLREFGGIKGLLEADLEQLYAYKSIGVAKATSIKAIYEVCLRLNTDLGINELQIKNPADVYKVTKKDLYSKKREHLYLLSLDSRGNLISKDLISIGTVNETLVHPREIYSKALVKNSVSIILVHNHPSQDTKPSSEDILLTERIAESGEILGIPLLDHVIVCDSRYTSVKSLGLFSTKNFSRRGGD